MPGAIHTVTEPDAIKWIADLFEEPATAIDASTRRDSIPAWDSLGVLTLLAALDEKFDVSLTDEETERLQSVRDILDLLRDRAKLA